jgi:hypothetical protein
MVAVCPAQMVFEGVTVITGTGRGLTVTVIF